MNDADKAKLQDELVFNRIIWQDVANYKSFEIHDRTVLYDLERRVPGGGGMIPTDSLIGLEGRLRPNGWYTITEGSSSSDYIYAAHNTKTCSSWYITVPRVSGTTKNKFIENVIDNICDQPIWNKDDMEEKNFFQDIDEPTVYQCPYEDRYKHQVYKESMMSHVKNVPQAYITEMINCMSPLERKRRRANVRTVYIVLQAQMHLDETVDAARGDVPKGMFCSQWIDVMGLTQEREFYDVWNSLFGNKRFHTVSVNWWDNYIYPFFNRHKDHGRTAAVHNDRDIYKLRLVKRKTPEGTLSRNLIG